MFIATIIKITGGHYCGSSAFTGKKADTHGSGPLLIAQLRDESIFPGLRSRIENGLDGDIHNQLFINTNEDNCIDVLGSAMFDFLRRSA